MKKLFMIAVAAFMVTISANAQNMYIKPMVGGTLATVTGDNTDNSKMKLGLVAGGEFGFHLSDPFALTAGVLVAMQGCGVKDHNGYTDGSFTTTYLNIPVLANFYVTRGLAIKAGLQPGFMLSLKQKYTLNGEKYESTNKDGYNKFDLSIPLGLSYEFSDFVIDARYNLGLTNLLKSEGNHDYKQRNGVIMLTVGYKIPL